MTSNRTALLYRMLQALVDGAAEILQDIRWLFGETWNQTVHRWHSLTVRQNLWKALLEEFETDYSRTYTPGQTRPPEVGRPFLLMPRLPVRAGVVLVHGYMAAPMEMRALGDYLRARGFAVLGVRLKGHGTAPEDLASRHYEEWYTSVARGIEMMAQITPRVGVCGFSAGGDLAILAAARLQHRIEAAVAICAPLRLRNRAAALAPSIVRVNTLMRRIGLNRFQWDYVDNHPENPHINYTLNPLTGVETLRGLMQETENALSRVTGKLLIVQASDDPVVHPESAAGIFKRAATRDKTLVLFSRDRHGIVNGEGSDAVFDTVCRFFTETLRMHRPRPDRRSPSDVPVSTIPCMDPADETVAVPAETTSSAP